MSRTYLFRTGWVIRMGTGGEHPVADGLIRLSALTQSVFTRTAVPGDRRAVSAALTPEGREAASAFHRDVSASLDQLTDVLPPDERDRFCRSLARVTMA